VFRIAAYSFSLMLMVPVIALSLCLARSTNAINSRMLSYALVLSHFVAMFCQSIAAVCAVRTFANIVLVLLVYVVWYGELRHIAYLFQLPEVVVLAGVWLQSGSGTVPPLEWVNALPFGLGAFGTALAFLARRGDSERIVYPGTPNLEAGTSAWSSVCPQSSWGSDERSGHPHRTDQTDSMGSDDVVVQGECVKPQVEGDHVKPQIAEQSPCCLQREDTIDSIGSSVAAMSQRYSALEWESALEDYRVEASRAARIREHQAQDEAPTAASDAMPFPTGFEALAKCQGAWQLIPEGNFYDVDDWLRAFVITGRVYFACDGSSGYIERGDDGVVEMEKGRLTVEGGPFPDDQTLCRAGKSGIVFRFVHFALPKPCAVDQFRGFWECTDGAVDPIDEWPQLLAVKGSLWFSADLCVGGFLSVEGERILILGHVCSLRKDGRELHLAIRTEGGRPGGYLRYSKVGQVANPWYVTA
jgi:hypothetical protein